MIKPFGNRVLVKREKFEIKSDFGIIIPDCAEEKVLNEGKIIAIGTDPEMKMREGVHVIFNDYTGMEIEIGGESHVILTEEEIVAFEAPDDE